ncbi:MAG TPA: glycosyltransferase [Novosphingobium sp.]|nr:glycosyltransferase [Novosphingobium sp.]
MSAPPEQRTDPAEILRLCIVGGSMRHRGGVEAFCARALAAIDAHAPQVSATWVYADTAYLGLSGLGRFLGRLRQIWRMRRSVDVVWVQVSNLPDLAFLLLLGSGPARVLATPHFGSNSRLQSRGWRRATCRRALGLADRLGLLFDDQSREIDLPPQVPCETIGTMLPRSACSRTELSPNAKPGSLRLVHAARFSEGKGSFAMVDLCARLKATGYPFQARLIGRADQATMTRLTSAIATAGIGEQVEVIAWLDEAAMQQALREADVLVHLSRLDSFPLIVLEAQAAGALPLIRPMTGGKAMVEAFGGYVLEERDAVSDSDAARTGAAWLVSTPLEEIRANGAAARARVRDAYAWPAVVSNLMEVIRRTLAGESRREG